MLFLPPATPGDDGTAFEGEVDWEELLKARGLSISTKDFRLCLGGEFIAGLELLESFILAGDGLKPLMFMGRYQPIL